ncbi:Chlorophyll a-b binding protein [Psidium guajava]|nr:Chlorophyll a-b binding protein [Psidium guajava]
MYANCNKSFPRGRSLRGYMKSHQTNDGPAATAEKKVNLNMKKLSSSISSTGVLTPIDRNGDDDGASQRKRQWKHQQALD